MAWVGVMPGACWGYPINGSPSCSRQLQEKASARMGVAFALLAPADPRAITPHDHAGTRLDDLHSVVLHVVDPAEDSCKSGRQQASRQKFRTETDRFNQFWTRVRRVRDREAPGSNPGPPTKSRIQGMLLGRSQCDNADVLLQLFCSMRRAESPSHRLSDDIEGLP
jgi:hypothetical protein